MDSSRSYFAPAFKVAAVVLFAMTAPILLLVLWTHSSHAVERDVPREIGYVLGVAASVFIALRIASRWVHVSTLTMYGGPVIVGVAHALLLWGIYRAQVETVKEFKTSHVNACIAVRGKAGMAEAYCRCTAERIALALTVNELRELRSRPDYYLVQPRIQALAAQCL